MGSEIEAGSTREIDAAFRLEGGIIFCAAGFFAQQGRISCRSAA